MNKYVVGFLSLHDGELKQEIVLADSALQAGIDYVKWWDSKESEPQSLEELYIAVYDGDCFIHVLEL